eukprot:scaffold22465_cov32-Prasinocladus_malaysianus.AAC.1
MGSAPAHSSDANTDRLQSRVGRESNCRVAAHQCRLSLRHRHFFDNLHLFRSLRSQPWAPCCRCHQSSPELPAQRCLDLTKGLNPAGSRVTNSR